MIGIINYGMGNLRSVQNALNHLSIPNEIFDDASGITKYSKLILPGVGAFGPAMKNLEQLGFVNAISDRIENKVPLLGICLGMQLLLEDSEEHGVHKGLGIIKGQVKNISNKVTEHPVPHMGWNKLTVKKESKLFNGIPADELIFYFVHNFYCELKDKNESAAAVNYGFSFDTAIETGNVFACQFHPEKSQKSGLQILKNFYLI